MLLLAFALEFFAYLSSHHFHLDFVSLMTEFTGLFSAWKELGCVLVLSSLGKESVNSRHNFIFLELLKWKRKGMTEKMTHQRDGCKQPSLAVYFPLVQL